MYLRSGKHKMDSKVSAGTSTVEKGDEISVVTQEKGDTNTDTQQTDMLTQIMVMMTQKFEENKEHMERNKEEMTQKFEENKEQMERIKEEMKNNMKEELCKMENKIDNITRKIQQEMTTRIGTAREEIRQEIQMDLEAFVVEGIAEISKKVEEKNNNYEKRLTDQEKKINQIEAGSNTNIIQTPTTVIQNIDTYFYGDNKIHPKLFIERLRQHLQNGNNNKLKYNIQQTLQGDAELWYQLVEDKYENFEQFEELFLRQYWNEFVQQKVRTNLFYGSYNPNYSMSREKYIMSKYYNIRQLEPKISEYEIVRYLGRHFEDDIYNVIITQRIATIESLLEY